MQQQTVNKLYGNLNLIWAGEGGESPPTWFFIDILRVDWPNDINIGNISSNFIVNILIYTVLDHTYKAVAMFKSHFLTFENKLNNCNILDKIFKIFVWIEYQFKKIISPVTKKDFFRSINCHFLFESLVWYHLLAFLMSSLCFSFLGLWSNAQ